MPAEKNQLNNTWSLWYECRPESIEEGDEWGTQQKCVYSFDSVEGFWSIYNNILPIHELKVNCVYHFFKKGIKPSWEDENNRNGGSWKIGARISDTLLEDKWETILLAVLGEALDPTGDFICGISFLMKNKSPRIEVWVKNAENQPAVATIGRRIRDLHIVENKEKIEFRKHGGEMLYQL